MATKLRSAMPQGGPAAKGSAPTFEEVFVRNDVVSLCLLLNRRGRVMRVIDFRAGATPAKRLFVQSIARRERIEKVVVLVERDECITWGRLGFAREGNIPGFYKRSDAFIMGCIVPALADASSLPRPTALRPSESGVFSVGRHSLYTRDDGDRTDEDDELAPPVANAAAEKTVVHARKIAKEIAGQPMMPLKIVAAPPNELQKRIALATRENRALTGFEPFGRDVTRDDVFVTAKGVSELTIGTEIQRCYGNAFLEVLTAPRDDKERAFLASALHATCARLLAKGIVCTFGLSPADNVRMATAFALNGFRRTGVLRQQLRIKGDKGERSDAILWSRKLASPQDDS